MARDLVLLAVIIAFAVYGTVVANKAVDASHRATRAVAAVRLEARARGAARVQDLRARCLLDSRRTAEDVNLNWVDFLSEQRLIRPIPPSEITPQERTAERALRLREDADFNAAFVKARTVDRRLAGLIKVRTGFGYFPQPRRWVLDANYSCSRAIRASG